MIISNQVNKIGKVKASSIKTRIIPVVIINYLLDSALSTLQISDDLNSLIDLVDASRDEVHKLLEDLKIPLNHTSFAVGVALRVALLKVSLPFLKEHYETSTNDVDKFNTQLRQLNLVYDNILPMEYVDNVIISDWVYNLISIINAEIGNNVPTMAIITDIHNIQKGTPFVRGSSMCGNKYSDIIISSLINALSINSRNKFPEFYSGNLYQPWMHPNIGYPQYTNPHSFNQMFGHGHAPYPMNDPMRSSMSNDYIRPQPQSGERNKR